MKLSKGKYFYFSMSLLIFTVNSQAANDNISAQVNNRVIVEVPIAIPIKVLTASEHATWISRYVPITGTIKKHDASHYRTSPNQEKDPGTGWYFPYGATKGRGETKLTFQLEKIPEKFVEKNANQLGLKLCQENFGETAELVKTEIQYIPTSSGESARPEAFIKHFRKYMAYGSYMASAEWVNSDENDSKKYKEDREGYGFNYDHYEASPVGPVAVSKVYCRADLKNVLLEVLSKISPNDTHWAESVSDSVAKAPQSSLQVLAAKSIIANKNQILSDFSESAEEESKNTSVPAK